MGQLQLKPGIFAQLPIKFFSDRCCRLDNFVATAANEELYQRLCRLKPATPPQRLFIRATAGEGGSHLLQAVYRQWLSCGGAAMYLPLGQLRDYPATEILHPGAGTELLCLDNLETIGGYPDWQEAVYNSFNRAVAAGGSLLFSSVTAPQQLDIDLADLSTRLQSMTVYRLQPLTEEERLTLMKERAGELGISLSDEVLNYIASRTVRSTGVVMALLARLDYVSLASRRRITVPLVKALMADY